MSNTPMKRRDIKSGSDRRKKEPDCTVCNDYRVVGWANLMIPTRPCPSCSTIDQSPHESDE